VAKRILWETVIAMRAQAKELEGKRIFHFAQIIEIVARDHGVAPSYTRKILNGDSRKTS
jgi:hypothetical protein